MLLILGAILFIWIFTTSVKMINEDIAELKEDLKDTEFKIECDIEFYK